jgi:hypothetical protein
MDKSPAPRVAPTLCPCNTVAVGFCCVQEVNHVWRMVRRSDIEQYSKAEKADWTIDVPEDYVYLFAVK